jgi:tight adherence protein C
MILYVIAIFTTITVLALVSGIYQARYGRRVAERLNRVVVEESAPITENLTDTGLPPYLRVVTFLGIILPNQVYSERLKWDLARAGYRHVESRLVFAGLQVLSTALLGVISVVTCFSLHLVPREILIFSALGTLVGYFMPVIRLRLLERRRVQDITLALPDALDLLVICLEAGQGLNAALVKVGREVGPQARALGEELRAVNSEMVAGVGRTQALRNFSTRTGVDDVCALVAVMIQSDRFGTSVVNALRIHAQSLRVKRRQRAEEAARKTPVKLVFPLIFCVFPELLVVILAPGMLELYRALSKMNQ